MKKLYVLLVILSVLFSTVKVSAQAASITWPLANGINPNAPVGNIQGTAESIGVGPNPTMSISSLFPYGTNGQQLWVGTTGWIVGPLDLTRFIQFDASPTSGNVLTVTDVSFNYGDYTQTTNLNMLSSQVFYSIDNWGTPGIQLNSNVLNYLNTTMQSFTATGLNILVGNSQTFSLRIYPYAVKSGMGGNPTYAIHNSVVISGTTAPQVVNGSICGTKFNDINGDGLLNGADAGLAGWTISLTYNSAMGGPVTLTTTTGADGSYCFNDLTANTYTVSEKQQSGWTQKSPAAPGTHIVKLGAGINIIGQDFGNQQILGSICGMKFNDINGDSIQNGAETGLSSWTISLTYNNAAGVPTTTNLSTEPDGSYCFNNLAANTYTVSETQKNGWTQTFPASQGTHAITLTAGLNVLGKDFGNHFCIPTITGTTPASICGTGTVTLGATASAGTINWYAALTGGASLGTGTSLITPSISSTTTYYVDATDACGTTAVRTAITATVNVPVTYYLDADADGYGGNTSVLSCTPLAGYVTVPGDCNDNIASIHPGAIDICNGIDDNCNGITDENAPTTANAGADQIGAATCGLTTTTLAGNSPSVGTGAWTITSGTGGTFTNSALYNTSFTGTAGTAYTLRWTISNAPCPASTDDVLVTFNQIPTITGTTPASRCGTGTVTLGATTSAGTINWYAALTGGTSIGTGTSFTTPGISTTTTYYVDATSGGCTTAARTAIVATINVLPVVSAPGSVAVGGTITLSPTTGGTWTSSDQLIATVTNSGVVTGVSAGSATFTFTDAITGCSATTSSVAVGSDCVFLSNTDFEIPVVSPAVSGYVAQGFIQTPEVNVPSWHTTASDGKIELWDGRPGAMNIPAYSGNQFAELNCTQLGTLFQTFTSIANQPVIISFAHMGRYSGLDKMEVKIGPSVIGPFVTIGTSYYDNLAGGWSYYNIPYTLPASGLYDIQFVSVYSNGGAGPAAGGNFLDAIKIVCATPNDATVNPGGPDQICQSANPTAITLSGASIGGSATTGAWSIILGGGTLSDYTQTATPATVTYTPAANFTGTVVLKLTTNSIPAISATRTITINPAPAAPAAITGAFTLCVGSTTQLADATTGGTWSSGTLGVATVGASTGLVTGISAGTTLITYTTAPDVNGCTNYVTQSVTVNASPTITGTTPASRCGTGTGTVTLGATASAGIINWYAAPTGGTSLGTGTSFITPAISTTTTYYVDATSGGCTIAARTAVTATVNAIPVVSAPVSIAAGSSVSLSPNTGGTWTSSNQLVATVSASGLVTGVSAGTVTFTFTNTITGCSATTSSVSVTASGNKPCNYLNNTDFEQFSGATPPTGYYWFPQANIPFWNTTATDGKIEIWHSGFGNVPAHSGTYFAEINATQNATLYQTFMATTTQTVLVSFWHRGRYLGVDVMKVSIVSPAGIPTPLGTFSDNNSAWNFYTVTYPITAPGGIYTLKFESVSSNNGTGPLDGGNFLDDINVTCPSSICGMKYNDLNGDGQKQATEPVLPNWEIKLTGPLTMTATTGADGSYCFHNLPAGSYTVQETQQSGWMQSAPATPETYSINIIEGLNVTGKDFGNRQLTNTSCTDFEDASLSGWQVSNSLSSIITDGTNHYIQTTDKPGASALFNESKPLTGDWTNLLANGCGSLCFDVNFLYAGNPYNGVNPPSTFTPYISISGNGFSAAFIITNPILAGSGWHSFCAPLAYLNLDGTLPSNADGHWVMGTGSNSDWNSLLSNVTRVQLPVDPTSYQAERFGYDNICLKNTGDCIVPCCEKVTVVPVLDAAGKPTCSAKITATCEVKSIDVTVTNGTLSLVNWNCTAAIPTGYIGQNGYTFAPGSCFPEITTSVNATTSGIVTIIYDITFSSGEKCQKKIELRCGVPPPTCCEQVKVEPVVDAMGKTNCSAKITTTCEVKAIRVTVTNGTLNSVNWNCTTAIPTGYIGLSAYTFAPGTCLPEMTTSVDATTSGTVTITYDITFSNGEICQKSVDLDCSVPTVVCCDKVKVEPVVDATGKTSCCAKITTTCEVKSISVIVSNGTLSSVNWNCPATIPTGYAGQTAYTFAPGSCTPVMTTCVDAIKSGMVTITYDIVFANGETCQKSIRLECSVASECVTPPTGMVLWLPGDGNANDISGLNNHGTLAGGTTYSTGKVAAAFKVSNYMDQITVADNSSLNFGTGNFSADAWIKTTDNIHTIAIADKRVPVGSNMFGYGLFITQGKLYFQMGDGSASLNQVVLNIQLADGIWHFVAATVDRKLTDGGKLYIDGSLVLTFDPTGKPGSISNTIPLIVAQNNIANLTATSYTFYLDEVELFNRAITGTEIASIYNAGSAGKCKLGSICGTKFNDLNGNGRRDKDEPGIPEWKITIGGTADLTAYTDRDGNYCFYNLEPGEYKIGEEVRAGWQQMVPATPGTYILSLPAGQNLTGLDFGNRLIPQTGSICGSKFNDLNGNGRRDEGEPGIGDWTILLGSGATEIKGTTDKNGDFCFENLKPGEYKLGEENRVGWLQMIPSGGSYNIILAAGQRLVGYEFGNMLDSRPASICGIKFNDLNGNGTQELTEPGLPNWTINLTGSATLTTITDRKGNFCFAELKVGTYTVSEVNQALWHQTTPHPTGTYTITLAAGEHLFNQNFGNQHDLECVTPPIGMLGWWPGDNNANDITLNGDFGTLVNGATFAPGMVGSAFSLMGTTDYVNIPDRPQLNPGNGDFTIDCWINTSEATGTFAILDKRGYDANQNISGYGLFVVDGHLQLRLSDSAGNGFAASLYNHSTMIADGQWHFVAATIEQGANHAVTLFVDGVKGISDTWGLPILSYSNNVALRIGEAYFSTYSNNLPAGHYHNFQGMIDEVEFIYGALSDAELAGIYNAGSAGKCKPAVQLGTICGSKFNDLNGNGLRDARGDGEPGLPNWTIKLTGAAILTTTTDANGNFCFSNLPAGQYTIAEVNQAGWIQTTPLNPNTFTVTLTPGGHIVVLNFGNKVDPSFGCVTPPSGMVVWLPGDGHARDISGFNNHGTLNGGMSYVYGKVDQAFNVINIDYADDYISVPDNPSLNFGTGNFSIDAWVKTKDNVNYLFIAHKGSIGMSPGSSNKASGYHLGVHQGKLSFYMGDGSPTYLNVQPSGTLGQVADGNWHLVAATVDRTSSTGGKLYIDGNVVFTFDPTSRPNSISNSDELKIAYMSYNVSYQDQIDEVEIFNRSITGAEIASIFNAGSSGKCKLGTICGMKFNDLNGNGKKEEGEPGISGWLINLSGTADMSVLTEKDGSFCFTNLNPGEYQIGEEVRDGWTQTTPGSPGNFTVTLPAGSNLTGYFFGNKLRNQTSCVEPPSGMVAWWALDETSGTTVSDFAGTNNSGTLMNGPQPVAGKVLKGLKLDGIDDYVEVPDQAELNFGIGDFSFDAWIQTTDDQIYGAELIDKRTVTTNGLVGYSFLLVNGKLSLQLAETWTSYTTYGSQVFVADGKWHHIAITVSRKDQKGILFYLDGVETQYGDPTLHPGSLTNSGPLMIGSQSHMEGYFFNGILDEIELFNRVITKAEITSIFNAGSSGKCKLGSICGTKYDDLNGNGRRDTGEPGIPEWKIMLDGPDRLTTITDKDGNYCFFNLIPGDYKITEELRPDWQQKMPSSGYYAVALEAGRNITRKDFGNMLNAQLGSICGMKYNDLNGNGKRDEGEPGIKDWTILIGGTADFSVQTDENGEFCITSLKPGTYKIGEQMRQGWIQTAPLSRYFTIELKAGDHITKLEFGNMLDPKTGSICGMKFNDVNSNGILDTGEQGLAGWTINLTGTATKTITTGVDGSYCFNDLPNGNYSVSEVNQSNWYPTVPLNPSAYTITLAAGQFLKNQDFGNTTDPCVSGIKSWSALGANTNNEPNDYIMALANNGADLYVGGKFNTVGGVSAINIAKWNGSVWSPLGSGLVGYSANSLAVFGGELYVGGQFNSAGGVSAINIAKWNGSIWSALGSGLVGYTTNAFAMIGGDLYVGGNFLYAGGITANSLAKWDGTNWSAIGTGIGANGEVNALAVMGGNLYAGGVFSTIDGVSVNNIAKWDGTSWTSLGSGINNGTNGRVRALAVIGSTLYAGGFFTTAGGLPSTSYIAKWDGTSWSSCGIGIIGNDVTALKVVGSNLYAGGTFAIAGGVSANNVAKWNGSSWSALGAGVNNYVLTLAEFGGDLYAGGAFWTAGGVSANHIAKYSCSVPTAVGEVQLQQPYQLDQNYPNPFSSTSTIGYSVPQTSQVKIIVYDLYGKEIKVLVNEEKEPGHHEIVFERKDFVSGIYFYTLKTAGFTQSKKMILMK